MKFVIENMVRFLVSVFAAALVLTSVARVFPVMQNFFPTAFTREENFVDSDNGVAGPEIISVGEVLLPAGSGEVDLFNSTYINVHSASGSDLMEQLKNDYAKAVGDRDHVFVYKINKDNTNLLCEKIDTSSPGNWMVIYLVSDDKGTASAKISYVVS